MKLKNMLEKTELVIFSHLFEYRGWRKKTFQDEDAKTKLVNTVITCTFTHTLCMKPSRHG